MWWLLPTCYLTCVACKNCLKAGLIYAEVMSGMEPLTPTRSCLSHIYKTSSTSTSGGNHPPESLQSQHHICAGIIVKFVFLWPLTPQILEPQTYGTHDLCSLTVSLHLSDFWFHRLLPVWFQASQGCLFLLPVFLFVCLCVWLPKTDITSYKFHPHTQKSSKTSALAFHLFISVFPWV